MRDDINAFIGELLLEKGPLPEAPLDGYDFVASGHVDSLGLLKFFMRIEDRFAIEITPADMVHRSLRTVGGVADMVERKLAARGGGE